MADHRRARRAGAAAVLAAVLAAGPIGCSGEDGAATDPGRGAESAASSLAAEASEALSDASESLESATAEADRRLDELTGGLDARDQVRLGTPTVTDGRAVVEVTTRNTTGSERSFVVQVEFTDRDGTLLDTVVLTVGDVPPGGSGTATARGHRDLSGPVEAEVARALRY
ncbi:FxLYD domain-containing protein [Streptomyces sp. NPDC085946]|uniref:FxLYD domain-containing protein n=1 Tax=Streptomyces sp. NPDC085946 TaxID=3365744 RepID=UPI0037D5FAAA